MHPSMHARKVGLKFLSARDVSINPPPTHSTAAARCDDHRPCIIAPGPLGATRPVFLACLPLSSVRVAPRKYLLFPTTPTPTPTPTNTPHPSPSTSLSTLPSRPAILSTALRDRSNSCIPPAGVAPRPLTLELIGYHPPPARPTPSATLRDIETHARRIRPLTTHANSSMLPRLNIPPPPAWSLIS